MAASSVALLLLVLGRTWAEGQRPDVEAHGEAGDEGHDAEGVEVARRRVTAGRRGAKVS